MKLIIIVIAFSLSFSAFAQDEHTEQKTVEETARKFIKALVYEKYDEAKMVSTEGTKIIIEQLKMVASMIPDSLQAEMEVRRKEAQAAVITFKKFQFEKNIDPGCSVSFVSSQSPANEEIIYLVKKNDVWLIDIEGNLPGN